MKPKFLLSGLALGVVLLSSMFFVNATSLESIKPYESQTALNWLEGWQFRKAHNVTGSPSGTQTNYPITINVRYDSGFDDEANVYLSGKCRLDFGDIRFTSSDGSTILDYWIEHKVSATSAFCWVEVPIIPVNPDEATIYIYYGNPNASSLSNSDWTLTFYSDFEDGTTQNWIISWGTHISYNGVWETSVFQGNYCRRGGRMYGSSSAGNGHFYERISKYGVYIPSGSYWIQCAARFDVENSYIQPQSMELLSDAVAIANFSDPYTVWRALEGNITQGSSGWVDLSVEFHLYTTSGLSNGDENYHLDSVIVRKWCDPEPSHGSWGNEETSHDGTPPEIHSVEWSPTSPYPYTPSTQPRNGEPVLVTANVTEEVDGSGIRQVQLSYSVNGSEWWNVSMSYNGSNQLWTTIIPGQPSNSTVEFFVFAIDNTDNSNSSSIYTFNVKYLFPGDLDGDGDIDIFDIVMAAGNYGKVYP